MDLPLDPEPPPPPFDPETWRRMIELVNFLRLHEMPPEVGDRVGQALVRLRLLQAREGGPLRPRVDPWHERSSRSGLRR